MPIELIIFIDLAARSALILGFAWGTIKVAPKLSAAARYWIWLTALCVLPLLLLTADLPVKSLIEIAPKTIQAKPIEISSPPVAVGSIEVAIAKSVVTPDESGSAGLMADPVAPQPIEVKEVPVAAAVLTPTGSFPSVFLLVYLLGVAVVALPMVVGLLRLNRLRRRAVDALAIADGFALSSGTKVLLSADISVPLTWGTLRPLILLPESASDWSHERLQVVFAHESAHIARRDFATGVLASALRAAFWFQPLSWIAHRRLRVEREIACDDRVLQSETSAAPDYAEHLSELVKHAGGNVPAAAVAMARPSEIVGRVRAILDSARNRASLSALAKGRITLLALALFAPLAFVRCAGEKSRSEGAHKTGNGIEMKAVNPAAITITRDGNQLEIPAGKEFSISVREVTQGEFEKLLGHNPASTVAANLPVDRVTRTEAATFCKVLTERDRADGVLPKGKVYRLPTQREWLLAAYPGGAILKDSALDAIAWHKGNSNGQLQPVGSKGANAHGLYDMIGNVAEWADPDLALTNADGAEDSGRYAGRIRLQVHTPRIVFGAQKDPVDQQIHRRTQMELMKSDTVLRNVVRESNLLAKWKVATDDEAVDRLASNVRVEEVRGTDLIDLTYFSDDRDEAADLANAIGSSYVDSVEELQRDRTSRLLEQLQLEAKSQERLMEEARAVMLKHMEEGGIIDLGGGSPKWLNSASATGSGTIGDKGRQEEESLRATIKALDRLEGDELIKAAVELGLANPTLVNRYPEYQTALLTQKSLDAAGLGSRHPKVLQVQGVISMLEMMLVDAVDSSRRTLATKLQIAKVRSAALNNTAEESSLDEKRRSVEYLAAKDEYELLKTLLSEMKQRIAIDSVNAKMPRQTVTVHEKAVSGRQVASAGTGTPLAIGGTAFDSPEDLAERSHGGRGDGRTTSVGFRIVMADE